MACKRSRVQFPSAPLSRWRAPVGGTVVAVGYSRAEIEAAFQRYRDAAAHAGRTTDWRPWVECFTEDCRYVEHLYGTFHGREAVLEWITATMRDFPFDHT